MSSEVSEMKGVHPAADVWPMLVGDDLDALASDIAENGLQNPLVLTPDGLLLDGRNRLAACKMVDVAPTFETFDGEPLAFIVSANLHRRHITKGQQAMCVAMMYPEPKRGMHADPSPIKGLGFGKMHLSRARTVLAADVHEAEKVRDGSLSLTAAYETVHAAIARRKADQEAMERLRSHPDLIEWVLESVTAGEHTVSEGLRLLAMDEGDRERVRSGGISIDEGEVLTRDRHAEEMASINHLVRQYRAHIATLAEIKLGHSSAISSLALARMTEEEQAILKPEIDRWATITAKRVPSFPPPPSPWPTVEGQ